jgi:DNA (cytosine-5)-methyltransferase 1
MSKVWRIKDGTKAGYTEFVPTPETTLEIGFPNSKNRRGRVKEGVTPTLDTSCQVAVFEDERIRLISELECWRLQGFPDSAYEAAKSTGVSDRQLRKQAGNSVTIPVIEGIARGLS